MSIKLKLARVTVGLRAVCVHAVCLSGWCCLQLSRLSVYSLAVAALLLRCTLQCTSVTLFTLTDTVRERLNDADAGCHLHSTVWRMHSRIPGN